MIDAMLRVMDELLWRLRRECLAIPTSGAIDALRAAQTVGLEDRSRLRTALACVLVKSASDRVAFGRGFDAFFGASRRTLLERLAALGFTTKELDLLREILTEDLGLLDRGSNLDQRLVGNAMERELGALANPLQRGYFLHRALATSGLAAARTRMGAVRAALRDALGARGDALAEALLRELDDAEDIVRAFVERRLAPPERSARPSREDKPLASLDPRETLEVRRAVRSFAMRLRGKERVRRRRARRGRIDPHRTMRRTLRTFGVPMNPAHVRRRRDRPRLVVLCDVSDSVRAVATFLLEFVYSAHDLFDATRSFVFVSDVGESTQLFKQERAEAAIAAAYGGAVVPVTGNSNYGRALGQFLDRYGRAIDRRTTVVVLGDGRTNYHDAGEPVLDRIRSRARSLLWICPEPQARWSEGDSAMARYAPRCTDVLCVQSARDLEIAARRLTHR